MIQEFEGKNKRKSQEEISSVALLSPACLQNLSKGFKTLVTTYEGLGEMFEGGFADTCSEHFSLMLMEDGRHHQACTDGMRGPSWESAAIMNLAKSSLRQFQ